MKRIFYFNITYGCNSNCIFCYSHNTWHNAVSYDEITAEDFFEYLNSKNVTEGDRVIVNGGEPFLHTEIDDILLGLIDYRCEVLVYTNGRLITQHNLSMLTNRFRFVIPIHGYESIHDSITCVKGSYNETLNGLVFLSENSNCLVDIKLIINNRMLAEDYCGEKLIESLNNVPFNNAVHITKMADTIVSMKNKCPSISNEDASYYTGLMFKYFKEKNRKIKLFDTCVKGIQCLKNGKNKKYQDTVVVYFKDKNQCRQMKLSPKIDACMLKCDYRDKCMSAVAEYKVLEYYNGEIYEDLE